LGGTLELPSKPTPPERPTLLNATKAADDRPLSYEPWVDGEFLAQDPAEALRDGKFRPMPVILGGGMDEEAFFRPVVPDEETYVAKVRAKLKPDDSAGAYHILSQLFLFGLFDKYIYDEPTEAESALSRHCDRVELGKSAKKRRKRALDCRRSIGLSDR